MNHSPLIVAVGASSGGIKAFSEFVKAIEDAPGLAIVFVHHLDSRTQSVLSETLADLTSMAVVEVVGRMQVEANTIYVCPSSKLLSLHTGSLVSQDAPSKQHQTTSIDYFFHSIAENQTDRGLGVVLSGTGSDGTLGLKAISDSGGITFAQDSDSAKYDSMPRNAATTGVADHVLPPAEIAAELLKYAVYLNAATMQQQGKPILEHVEQAISEIADRLLKVSGHNFQHYKLSTLGRRIQRRMQVLRITRIADYLKLLDSEDDEPQNLFRELLIGVTAFFRDPISFRRLAEEVLPRLFQNRRPNDPVHIWVSGCATGEEAYTIAILCQEFLDTCEPTALAAGGPSTADAGSSVNGTRAKPTFQIFATDIDEHALSIARRGIYPIGISENVSEERLEKFFVMKSKRYHVKKEIRERVLFSTHNLISDPPFSRLDLIACRNLLIYLGPHLQKKLVPLFHYSLRPNGYLFLGPSESISSHGELFRAVDATHCISQRKGTAIPRSKPLSLHTPAGRLIQTPGSSPIDNDMTDVVQVMQRIILDEFAPKSAVVDDDGKVICLSGETDRYLSTGEGAYENSIVKMARRGLRIGLRAALLEAKTKRRRVTHENVSVETEDGRQRVMLTVQPMMRLGEDTGLFIVVFHDVGLPLDLSVNPPGVEDESPADGTNIRQAGLMLEQLERELATTRDDLDNTIQAMETANEELKSSNEELLLMNEELQSANEELEKSKEEIRSGSDAIARANNDLENLLRSTGIATIFLDDDQTIRSYTPTASEIYGLIPTDVGRPLTQIVPNMDEIPEMPQGKSLSGDEPVEDTIIADNGRAYIRRVLPYQTHLGGHEGIVVTFTDITELQQSREQLAQRESRLSSILNSTAEGIYGIDLDGNCTFANPACVQFLGYDSPDELIGRQMHDLIHHTHADGSRYPHTECPIYKACLKSERVHVDDEVFWRADGSCFDAEYWSSPKMRNEEVLGCVITFLDISARKKTELELADARTRLEISLQVSDVAPWVWDAQTSGPAPHPTLNRLYGFEENAHPALDDFLGRIDDSARERVSAAIARSMQTGEVYDEEYPVRWPSGEQRHVRARGRVRTNHQGEVEDFFGVALDITERKVRELDIAEREAHLRRVIDNQLGFVGVLDLDGTLLEANATALLAAGLNRDEVIGKKFWDCYWWNYDEDVTKRLHDSCQLALAGEDVRYDAVIRVAGDARTAIDFMIRPVRDAEGRITHLIPSGVDISERKQTEIALQESEQVLRVGMSVAEFALARIEYQSGTIHLSPEAALLYGIGKEAVTVTRQELHDTFHEDDKPMVNNAISACIANQNDGLMSCEHRVVLADGIIRWLDVRKQVYMDNTTEPPTPTHGILAAQDITASKWLEQSLNESREAAEAANESKSEFLANMSHEIRTPMTAILGYADLVSDLVDNPEALEHLRTIRRNGDFLLDIINDILDLSKIEAGKLDISEERFSPQRLVEDVRSIMEVRATEENLRLDVEYHGKIPSVIQSDAKRLKQVLINLVGNAIKFTKEGGVKVVVQCEPQQCQIRFSIVDTGIGMSEEQQKNLFQPFSQGDGNVNREFGGTGLGLAISKRLTELLSGEISLESNLGEGSTFVVTIGTGSLDHIDMIDQSSEIDAKHPVSIHDEIRLSCHVLVVDDRRDIRFLSKRFLTAAGATVAEAEDGELAVEAVKKAQEAGKAYDLILLDMQMPKLDGYETAKALRRLGYTGPIIALTADAMQGDMNRCIESGCNDYLSKPIDKRLLLHKVKTYVAI
ncbi:chemotaxis protein CheB [Rubripirellula reticaptiva]|uniref:Autoinducer 2 sensor kinase/phosphatase LuxQ n=1 Tax=Rubripirellula reticaptiva TaxID=2528013 RepID=A0A5C6EHY1_9BACT|nr:chemotaxis protein CheB [Rubripirellula reticaptiva]TWU46839.1 Autoinducer 2 sensor kinase/phosphatase LuxQ [Rubripirellula reticaptiva]